MTEYSLSEYDHCAPHKTIHEALRSETAIEHQRLEASLNLLRPDFNRQEYCKLLVQYHGLYASFEAFMTQKALRQCAPAVFYCQDRCKEQWLADDLHAFGVETITNQPSISFDDFDAALPSQAHTNGAIYVSEGSMLGGCLLSKHFSKHLGIQPDTGGRFFHGYGRLTREKWLNTLQYLSTCDEQGLSRADVISGAKQMFSLFEAALACAR